MIIQNNNKQVKFKQQQTTIKNKPIFFSFLEKKKQYLNKKYKTKNDLKKQQKKLKFFIFLKNKFNKQNEIKKTNQKKNSFLAYLEKIKKKKNLNKKQIIKKKKITNYLYSRRKKKIKYGFILKKPSFNEIKYPIKFNFKLINEFLKKK